MKKFLLLAATLICGTAFAQSENKLTAYVSEIDGGDVTIVVGFDNEDGLRDFQFDLTLPTGFSVDDCSLLEDRMPYKEGKKGNTFYHGIGVNEVDGVTRFVVNDVNGNVVKGTTGDVMEIYVTGSNVGGSEKATFSNVVLSFESGTKALDGTVDVVFTVSGVHEVNAEKQDGRIYDLQGRRVQKAENGVFIINGKKVLK